MSEAKKKPQAWTGQVTILDRFIICQALIGGKPPCPACGIGKMTFAEEPQKIDRYNRLWEALDLDPVETPSGSSTAVLNALLGRSTATKSVEGEDPEEKSAPPIPVDAPPIDVTLANDLVRFLLVDVLAPRARFSFGTGVSLYLPIIKRLLDHAELARMKLDERGRQPEEDQNEIDDQRILNLSERERSIVWNLLLRPSTCSNPFSTMNGTKLMCGRPNDGPRSIPELQAWCRLIGQLRLEAVFTGDELEFGESSDRVPHTLDVATARLLLTILSGRIHQIDNAPRKLSKVVADLEAIKGGAGKPPAAPVEPEKAATPPTAEAAPAAGT